MSYHHGEKMKREVQRAKRRRRDEQKKKFLAFREANREKSSK